MNNTNNSEPATKADLKDLATKADIQALKADMQALAQTTKADTQALKADMQALAQTTKADMQALAQTTKADMQALAQTTKADLTAVDLKLSIAIAKTQADVRDIKHHMATKMATKDDINRILGAIDTYTAEAISYRNRDTLRGGKIMEHETKLSNHENRITLLETAK
ncbi:MAG TPA: hypothetical protein DCS63_01695 [Elusimicrobia bacterium]|nr:hypothetical protein [Elusimicrobiota bacterium]